MANYQALLSKQSPEWRIQISQNIKHHISQKLIIQRTNSRNYTENVYVSTARVSMSSFYRPLDLYRSAFNRTLGTRNYTYRVLLSRP
jgi:hypothetical protein